MQTQTVQWVKDSDFGAEAEEIIRRCVHCGFCLATCPSYQLLGDELDSPRGRIYQIKQVLEGEPATLETQLHLDRCLTCRNCETTCPSGVRYGALVDIGRAVVAKQVRRPLGQRFKRAALRRLLGSPWFASLYRLGLRLRPLLPAALKDSIVQPRAAGALPAAAPRHARQVIMLANCVQPAMMPSIDGAMLRVLDRLGIGASTAAGSTCCGAINFHLDEQQAAATQMRTNIDAWLALLESGAAEAVVVNASGCGGMLKDYAQHLKHDPEYAARAARLMPYIKDIAEFLAPMAAQLAALMQQPAGRYAFHAPCSLQHWQGLRVQTERLLGQLGFDLQGFEEAHLCCGAAGTYSISQPQYARELRARKLAALAAVMPDNIISANIGCICHLQAGAPAPVLHWIEAVDALCAQ